MKIHVADFASNPHISATFVDSYVAQISEAYKDASVLLPFGSKYVNFLVQPSDQIIAETGNNGFTSNSELIIINFDSQLKLGPDSILKNVRATVFHEMNHAARFELSIWHETALDMCLFEGLASVFEREHSGVQPLWSQYDSAVITEWLAEVMQLDGGILTDNYRFEHPDGRRWISYKVGTYIVDEAKRKSGKTVIELTQLECSEILKLANIS